jgi:hypothetical protein
MAAGITRADVRSAGFWFAGALALYLATGARGLVWADSSKLTLYAFSGYFPSLNPGDHAGWTVLAWGWLRLLGGDPVVAAHRLSAVFGALAVALAMLVIVARTGDRERAHTTAALLLVALPVWWAATVAETYTAALALVLGGALAAGRGERLRAWRWLVAGALWGLGAAVHALALFLVAAFGLELGWRKSWRLLPGALVGFAPVWAAALGSPPDPMTGFAASGISTWRWVWGAFVAFARAPRGLAVLAAIVAYSLGPVGLVALWRGRRGPRGGLVWGVPLAALAVLLATYAPYRLHLMAVFVIAGALIALPVRLGAIARSAVAVQALVYLAVPAAATIAGRQDLGVRVLPYRNNAFYFLCPLKGLPAAAVGWRPAALFDPGTERYVAALGECAPPDAAVVADFNPGAPLRLAQVARGWRPDLQLHPVAVDVALASRDPVAALAARIRRELASRPVVLADTYEPYYHLRELAAIFDLRVCLAGAQAEAAGPGTTPRPAPD